MRKLKDRCEEIMSLFPIYSRGSSIYLIFVAVSKVITIREHLIFKYIDHRNIRAMEMLQGTIEGAIAEFDRRMPQQSKTTPMVSVTLLRNFIESTVLAYKSEAYNEEAAEKEKSEEIS